MHKRYHAMTIRESLSSSPNCNQVPSTESHSSPVWPSIAGCARARPISRSAHDRPIARLARARPIARCAHAWPIAGRAHARSMARCAYAWPTAGHARTRPTVSRVGVGLSITRVHLLSILIALISLTACTDQPGPDGSGNDTTALSGDTVTGDDQTARADTIEVALADFEIDMPNTLPGGRTVFQVINEGMSEHNFEIEGQGIEQEFPQNLMPGETRSMEVELQPGSYTIYCPVADHQSRGMELELSVESAQGGILGN